MKLTLSVLIIVTALIGCSSGSNSNNNGNNPFAGPPDDIFQKGTVPAGAASNSYLQGLVKTLKDSNSTIPGDKALFAIILKGPEVEYVSDAARKEETDQLNNTGRNFLNSIRAQCAIKNATVNKDNRTIVPDKEIEETVRGDMKISGVNCPYLKSGEVFETTNSKLLERRGDDMHVTVSQVQKTTTSVEIRDAAMKAASGLSAMNMDLTLKIDADIWTKSPQSQNMTSSMTGNVEIKLSNGDYIRGPLNIVFEFSPATEESKPEITSIQALFDGTTSQGAVRLVMISKKGASAEFYVNGQLMDLSDLEAMGMKASK